MRYARLICWSGCLSLVGCVFFPFWGRSEETKAFFYLNTTLDQFHRSFDVYTDHEAGGNHFYPTGWMGDTSSVTLLTNCTETVYSGRSCLKVSFQANGHNWVSLYWQEPGNNWATIPNAGYDLTGASHLVFRVKGKNGGEKVEFFAGGLTGAYPDSFPRTSTGLVTLSNVWAEYAIDLAGKDLSQVIGGFGFTITGGNNPEGAIFYLDDIRYEISRLNEPRLANSYRAVVTGEPDKYFLNAAFIYDNALTILAYLSRGTPEDLRRAGLIADALLLARDNDRFYQDGRLRNAYQSGDILEHLTGKARLPGWWDDRQQRWFEDEDQISTYTGNLAWVMIAWLHYYRYNPLAKYLQAAISLGNWIYQHTYSETGSGGYTAGYRGWEPEPTKLTWKST
ncbi:MAG: hypothetical protein NC823_02235, partial [Candidatus Omnitrophica bacterium]|nr:hypothetical protein [Candidatus Omnitrophota bacterium]